ncbi:MAG: zinc-ribbon domain-containing protein, partial [Deltaproteobacteria bacterium]|nr:zinc-ribbon domain-containing protein [Deltaproteobacteria bacterium]
MVACENCATRYRVRPEVLTKPNLRLKCSRCGHLFSPPALSAAPPMAPPPPTGGGVSPSGTPRRNSPVLPPDPHYHSPPPRSVEMRVIPPEYQTFSPPQSRAFSQGEGHSLSEYPHAMPVPDESRLDAMFQDLQEETPPPKPSQPHARPPGEEARPPGVFSRQSDMDSRFFDEEPPAAKEAEEPYDPEKAYLEAISLYDEEEPLQNEGGGSPAPVDDSRRHKLFLKPGDAPPHL